MKKNRKIEKLYTLDAAAIMKSMRKYGIQFFSLTLALVLLLNGSYMLFTWLSEKFSWGQNAYLRSELQFLGTALIAVTFMIIIFAVVYRRRKKEITILSENILRVANGDFTHKIVYNKRDTLAHVYQNFNKMSAELESVQFLRKDFINNFSHEFKTPIASINGFASLMLEKKLSAEEQKAYLEIIRDESERLSRLTSNTILLSKLSSQEVLSHTEQYDLGEQLRQCAIILSPQWLEKQQIFSGDFPKIDFVGNRELMQHLWLNLLGNAIKYTPVSGEISVVMTRLDNTCTVTISDTGIGMDQNTKEHLFNPYFQGNNPASAQGLGLGLSIAKQIVDMAEGSILVDSSPGEGSTFTITLPLHLPKSAENTRSEKTLSQFLGGFS